MTFQREERYTVLKISDVHEALDPDECSALIDLESKVAVYREVAGKKPLVCAVVESDWPEYEPTWEAIKRRVESSSFDPAGSTDTVTMPRHVFDMMVKIIKQGASVGGGWWNDNNTWKTIAEIENATGINLR